MPKTIRQQYVPYINIYLRFSCCNCSSLADIVLAFEISQLHQITHTHTHTCSAMMFAFHDEMYILA